ncbi:MAG: NAD-dependent epimerase/dehydratase family protein [Candidatus Sedimenticola sp. 6PFRAG1]
MKILITGGAGSLGSNIVEHYLPQGHEILVIDNFTTSSRAVFPESIDGLSVVEGSVTDTKLMERHFANFKPSHVIHSAASYKDPRNWREDAETNIIGTINVVEAALRHNVRRIVNFQTALCYGRPMTVPIPINHPEQPFTSYGISKTAGEQFLALSGLPYVSLRLANVTGPRLAIGPIPTFYSRLKDGKSCFASETVRDFLDMSDFLSLLDLVMAEDACTGTFNVSTGEGKSIENVFNEVVKYLGLKLDRPVEVRPVGDDDVPSVVLDPSETTKAFGWQAKIDFEDTIKRMLQWYDQHGINQIYSHLSSSK